MDPGSNAQKLIELAEARERVRALEAELGIGAGSGAPPETAVFSLPEVTALLVEFATDMVSVHASNGDYLYVSPSVESLVGWRPDQLVGTNAYALFHPDDLDRIAESHASQDGRGRRDIYRLRRADGGWRWVETASRAHVSEAGVEQIVCVTRDVEDRKRAELALLEANSRLQQYASLVAHDLKSPLQTVIGYVDLLTVQLDARLLVPEREILDSISRAAGRLARQVDGVLLWSRLESGEPRPLVPTDLGEVAREVIAALSAQVSRSGATVELGALPVVCADPPLASLLLQNLVSNALKFHLPEHPPTVRLRARREGEFWQLSVQDDGIGIPDFEQRRIFELFRRLHSRAEYPGDGIGLALCARIVERHGGRIWVESEPGAGATFHVTLRGAAEDGSCPPAAAPS